MSTKQQLFAVAIAVGALVVLAVDSGCAGFDDGASSKSSGLEANGEIDGDADSDGGDTPDPIDQDDDGPGGDVDRDDCKIEDGNLGSTEFTVQLASGGVRVSSWTAKDGEAGEYVGFALEGGGADLVFKVKAGGDVFEASGDSWAHPLGTGGPDVSGISHIDFCDNDLPPSPEDPVEDPVDGDAGGDGGGDVDGDDGACTGEFCPPPPG